MGFFTRPKCFSLIFSSAPAWLLKKSSIGFDDRGVVIDPRMLPSLLFDVLFSYSDTAGAASHSGRILWLSLPPLVRVSPLIRIGSADHDESRGMVGLPAEERLPRRLDTLVCDNDLGPGSSIEPIDDSDLSPFLAPASDTHIIF
eukprot:CAMPEP_0198206744 /NCGR_PEP_ID=MMETSP1445-20131203/10298_1 /TAXON_ID=36898 /ORGANISM="Pyramimonas sp., Strain CCMP2087" /LENGTH=143 /DNA_ID=CAMNT_0043879567 /DNA_START=298 /DNA_END=726 /DNA_ORIENTATION=-